MRLKNVQLMLQVYLHNTQNIVSGFLNEAKAYSIERKDDYINIYENITDEFLNEIKAYSMNIFGNILPVYGISQNPDTKDYIMVLGYAKGGNFNYWCLDSNPVNRLKAAEIEELLKLYYYSYKYDEVYDEFYKKSPAGSSFKIRMKIEKEQKYYEIERQFKISEEYRKVNQHLFINNLTTHLQAIYTSRLLNPFVEEFLKDDINKYKITDDMSVDFCSLIEESSDQND
ncbi:unnamed protein product [Rhizophagus irregularis]|uniref:Uncharacterized protein n=1 Tax=Rhizophagus irregularis TaxID=588596 RepID=A0A916ECG3_9GLOM|nr:unnamed protein product [Rhizophagus irregularis]